MEWNNSYSGPVRTLDHWIKVIHITHFDLSLVDILRKIRDNDFVGRLRANRCCDDSFCRGSISDTSASSRADTCSSQNLSTGAIATTATATNASGL